MADSEVRPLTVSFDHAQVLLGGVSDQTIRKLVAEKALPQPVRVGGRSMFMYDELVAAVRALPRGVREQRNRSFVKRRRSAA